MSLFSLTAIILEILSNRNILNLQEGIKITQCLLVKKTKKQLAKMENKL